MATTDWDELKPKPRPTSAIGDDLTTLSIAELEARIKAFEAEIERTRAEIAVKRSRQSAADQLFKS
jgi:uncharacterized small protein (DUF1192 family)